MNLFTKLHRGATVAATMAACVLTAIACSPNFRAPANDAPTTDETVAAGIIGGSKVDLSTDPLAPSIVELTTFVDGSGTYWTCTGTLVGPQVVLTAGHCVNRLLGKQLLNLRTDWFGNPTYGRDFPQMVVASVNGEKIAAAAVAVPPGLIVESNLPNHNDIALVKLVTPLVPVNRNGTAALHIRLDFAGALKPDLRVLAMGYGLVAKSLLPGGGEEQDGLQRKTLRVVDPTTEGYSATEKNGDILLEALRGAQPGVTCQGDSGGPILIIQNQRPLVTAVTSRGEKSCREHTLVTTTAGHAAWIKQQLAKWHVKAY